MAIDGFTDTQDVSTRVCFRSHQAMIEYTVSSIVVIFAISWLGLPLARGLLYLSSAVGVMAQGYGIIKLGC